MRMAEGTGTFSVLAADDKLPDFALVSKVISESRGWNRDDAGRAARHAWGFLGEDLNEDAAALILERCALYGLGAVKVPAALIPALQPPVNIKKSVLAAGNFNYADGGSLAGSESADDILVLAAAPVKETTSRTVTATEGPSGQEKAVRLGIMAVTGLPIGLGKSKEVKKEIKSSEVSFCLDIVLRTQNPPSARPDNRSPAALRRLRLGSNDFDFSCLREKKTYSSQTNFRLMCAELAAFAPRALRNAGLLALLAGTTLAVLPYETAADLEKETLRLAALAALRGL